MTTVRYNAATRVTSRNAAFFARNRPYPTILRYFSARFNLCPVSIEGCRSRGRGMGSVRPPRGGGGRPRGSNPRSLSAGSSEIVPALPANAKRTVRQPDRLSPVPLELKERANRVHVLGHDVALLMDRLEVVQVGTVDDVDPVLPDRDLIQVRPGAPEVASKFHDLRGGLDPFRAADELEPWRAPPHVKDLVRRCRSFQTNADRVQMHDRRGDLHRDRVDIQVREYALHIRTVVARHLKLRLNRVNRTLLRIAGVCGASDHQGEDVVDAEVDIEWIQRADESCRIARRYTDKPCTETLRVVHGRIEAEVRELVFLAALPDRFDTGLFVGRLESALLGCRLDDEVRFLEHVVQGTVDLDPRLVKLPGGIFCRRVQRISLLDCKSRFEVRRHLRNTHDFHVAL